MFKTLILASFIVTPVFADNIKVEAFHDHETRLVNVERAERIAEVTAYDLSAPDQLEEKLSEGLSSNPAEAKKQAQTRIKNGGRELQQQLTSAYEGSLKAMQYDIQKLPAVIFNGGQYVIYGEADVHRSIQMFKDKRGQ